MEKTAATQLIEGMERRILFLERRREDFPEMSTQHHRIGAKIKENLHNIEVVKSMGIAIERAQFKVLYIQGRYDQWHDGVKPEEKNIAENAEDFIDETFESHEQRDTFPREAGHNKFK